jgi:N-acetylglutamate synthase-like GNAT family acetyltransferase
VELQIRAADNQDCPDIFKLIFNIWIHEYGFKVVPEDYPDLQDVQKYYFEKGGTFFVAIEQGKLIGTIACEALGGQNYALKRMFVHQDFRGEGVAQQLFDNLLQQGIFPQGASLYLSTKEDQAIAAKKFYLKNGFDVIEKENLPSTFPLFYEDDLFMRRDL